MIMRVITGGQTGVDQGALRAARTCGLATGGWAPLGWETEVGPAPWLADYGLVECSEPGYAARRRRNVKDADTRLLFGDQNSRGSIGLLKDWATIGNSRVYQWVEPEVETPRGVARFLDTLARNPKAPEVLLVAGNRESGWPGIGERTERLLKAAFRLMAR
jgi:hypothetical protein